MENERPELVILKKKKRKILIGKSKHIVKVVDQTVIKLAGTLKEKVVKSSISTVSS